MDPVYPGHQLVNVRQLKIPFVDVVDPLKLAVGRAPGKTVVPPVENPGIATFLADRLPAECLHLSRIAGSHRQPGGFGQRAFAIELLDEPVFPATKNPQGEGARYQA